MLNQINLINNDTKINTKHVVVSTSIDFLL